MYKTIEQLLHVKSEDLRLYDLVNENSPVLLEDETLTIRELGYESSRKPSKESYKLLIESKFSQWKSLYAQGSINHHRKLSSDFNTVSFNPSNQ